MHHVVSLKHATLDSTTQSLREEQLHSKNDGRTEAAPSSFSTEASYVLLVTTRPTAIYVGMAVSVVVAVRCPVLLYGLQPMP